MTGLGGIINSMDMSLSKLWETVKNREAWHAAFQGVTNSQTQQLNNNNNILFGNTFQSGYVRFLPTYMLVN